MERDTAALISSIRGKTSKLMVPLLLDVILSCARARVRADGDVHALLLRCCAEIKCKPTPGGAAWLQHACAHHDACTLWHMQHQEHPQPQLMLTGRLISLFSKTCARLLGKTCSKCGEGRRRRLQEVMRAWAWCRLGWQCPDRVFIA
eukprot:359869-Chlamydomonas_euryale.AAC.25